MARVEEMVPLEAEPAFKNLTLAPPRWHEETNPLARAVLQGLLERATRAALNDLSPMIDSLQRHAARYLELDRARLGEYYDQIERDLQRRAGRATDDGKRAAMESKLAAAHAERQAKLADVESKYKLRAELELVNLLVVAQPKIVRVVQIENRTTTINRMVVWDPLLHRLEPLVCDACGQPSSRLFLCNGGHLAHEECLLPQCVDCKRAFCKLCQGKLSTCAVCDRPVCTHSLNRCGECGRDTFCDERRECAEVNSRSSKERKRRPSPARQVAHDPSQPRHDRKLQADLPDGAGRGLGHDRRPLWR